MGLGERNIDNYLLENGRYTIWNYDQADQFEDRTGGGNTYGSHPMYLLKEPSGNYHVCFFQNSHAMDVIINDELLTYKAVRKCALKIKNKKKEKGFNIFPLFL